jgi:hypothetical protein
MRQLYFATLAAALLVLWVPARARADLRVLDSDHYRIHTDLERAFTQDLARRLDSMYDEYVRRLSDFHPSENQRLEVYLFKSRSDYHAFTEDRLPNTGGMFIPSKSALCAFLEGQGRDALRRTLQHEAFHQFAFFAISRDLPPWVNEGLAELFEEGLWTGQTFKLGQVPPRRLRELQAEMKARKLIPFKTLMAMTPEEWAGGMKNTARGAVQYNQAWAMVHFLVYAADGNGAAIYRRRFIDMLNRLHAGADGAAAFNAAFSDNLDGFQARFRDWAPTLTATPEAILIEREDLLAFVLSELLERGKRFDSIEELHQAFIHAGYGIRVRKGEESWKLPDANPAVLFSTLDGEPLSTDELFFSPRSGAPLPDIVMRQPHQIRLRAIFHDVPGGVEHEVLVE